MKRLIARILALTMILSLLSGFCAAETVSEEDRLRVDYSPDTIYSVDYSVKTHIPTAPDGEAVLGNELTLTPGENAPAQGENGTAPAVIDDESAVAGQDPGVSKSRSDVPGEIEGEGLDEGPVKQLTMEDVQAMNPDSPVLAVFSNNGYLSMLLGKYYDKPINDIEDGIRSIQGMAALLGFGKGSEFFAVYASRTNGYTFYTYQQRYGRYTLRYATLRIIVDPQGYAAGLSCSFTPNAGMASHEPKITAEEALEIVKSQYAGVKMKYYPEYTSRQAAFFYNRLFDCYVVYTSNPDVTVSFDMPYLEHFVTVLGEYTFGIPTNTFVADSTNVMDNSAYFEGFQMREYTRTMTLEDGSKRTVTVPVGYNPNDGRYYLVDPERKIAVADYYDFNYENKVTFITSSTEDGWSQNNLMAYANYRIMYDFYADHGIKSVDGFETPILITVGWCDENRQPVDNACFYGVNRGWACFGISDINHYGDALDVVGHEYTHGIARQSMQGNLGSNETGAIGEAYSDIMGNLAEMSLNYTDDRTWKVAEHTGNYIRDMGKPNDREQPEFVGDRYYKSPVTNPNSGVNDSGGVHKDNSLLGHIAYLMDQTGMTYEQQISMWLTALEIITPLSDYSDLHGALLLSLKINGLLDDYGAPLNRAFAAAGLNDDWTESYLTATRPGCGRVIFDPLDGFNELLCAVYFLTPDGDIVDHAFPDPSNRISALLPAGTYVARLLLKTDTGDTEIYNYTGSAWNTTGKLLAFDVRNGAVTQLGFKQAGNSQYGEINLVTFDSGYFSMLMPEGWRIEVDGEFAGLSFKLIDPDNPSTQFFYFGGLTPYHKSEAARIFWGGMIPYFGKGPVLPQANIIGILDCWEDTIRAQKDFGKQLYTDLYNINFVGGSYYNSGSMPDVISVESACFATCDTNWEEGCYLTISGQLIDTDIYNMYGGKMYYTCLGLYGILAPADRYDQVFDPLQECFKSIRFTNSYINASQRSSVPMAPQATITARFNYVAEIMREIYDNFGIK